MSRMSNKTYEDNMSYTDIAEAVSADVAGKTVKSITAETKGAEDWLVFTFTDGVALRIYHDYIYEIEIVVGEGGG